MHQRIYPSGSRRVTAAITSMAATQPSTTVALDRFDSVFRTRPVRLDAFFTNRIVTNDDLFFEVQL
jgi:hypothetical protein